MLSGNHSPPNISFPSLFKKKSENFGGGGFEPPEPPLKYALVLHLSYIIISVNRTVLFIYLFYLLVSLHIVER